MSIEVSLPPLPEEFKALATSAPATTAKANETGADMVGRCRLTVSKPVLQAPMVSALETLI
jgi:hypothetical protein